MGVNPSQAKTICVFWRFLPKHLVDSIIYITFAEYIRQPKTIMQEHTLSDNGRECLNSGAVEDGRDE